MPTSPQLHFLAWYIFSSSFPGSLTPAISSLTPGGRNTRVPVNAICELINMTSVGQTKKPKSPTEIELMSISSGSLKSPSLCTYHYSGVWHFIRVAVEECVSTGAIGRFHKLRTSRQPYWCPKKWNSGHVSVPKQYCGNLNIFLDKQFPFNQKTCPRENRHLTDTFAKPDRSTSSRFIILSSESSPYFTATNSLSS